MAERRGIALRKVGNELFWVEEEGSEWPPGSERLA